MKDTEENVEKIKKGKGNKGNFILSLITGGPLVGLLFTVAGALLLIGFTRVLVKKWSDAYMPKTDVKKATILGVKIPGVG